MYPDLFENLDFDHSPMLYLPEEELLKKYKSKKWYAVAIDRVKKHAEEVDDNSEEIDKSWANPGGKTVPKETYDQGISQEDQYKSTMANVNRKG